MKSKMEYYVYLHIKETTGEPFYVGKGKGIRIDRKFGRSDIWNRIVNKYGYDKIMLEEGLTEEESFEREIYWINRIGRRDLGTGTLVNFTDGGEGNSNTIFSEERKRRISEGKKNSSYVHSEETKKKMSESRKGKNLGNKNAEGNTPWNKGLKYKNEKVSESHMGNSYRAKEIKIDGIMYNSIKEASDILDIKYGTLYKRIRTKNKIHNYE